MIGEASGSRSRARPSISSAISRPGDAVAHQRLVHVEVEQADLGVGDLRDRLAVDAHELEERDEREAGREHRGDVAQQLQVVLGRCARGSAGGIPIAVQMRSISAGSSPVSSAASAERVRRPRPTGTGPRCSRRRAGRSPTPRASCAASSRARAGARRSARGRPRPASSAPSRSGTMPSRDPAPQGRRRDVDPAARRRRGTRRSCGRHYPRRTKKSGGAVCGGSAACGQCGPLPRPAAFVCKQATPCEVGPSLPGLFGRCQGVLLDPGAVNARGRTSTVQTTRCGYSASTIAR